MRGFENAATMFENDGNLDARVPEGTIAKLDAHMWEREAHEHYVEPEWCSRRLFDKEKFEDEIWDPCCGFGTIPEAAKKAGLSARGTDKIDRGYALSSQIDFFSVLKFEPYPPNIVCNPPFNIADRFALHALGLLTRKVAMIFPTARLNAAHWLHGTPLKRVWLMSPRPSMPPGHVIARGEKPGGGKMDYCWLVWERGHQGPSELHWLYRGGGPGWTPGGGK